MRKRVLISVSIYSNLVEEPIFLCHFDPHHVVASFVQAFEILASQSKVKIKNSFLDFETTIRIKLGNLLEELTLRHKRREQMGRFDMKWDDCENEISASTQLIQIQKNHIFELQGQLERYCNVLAVFGFNSAKYDLNLLKDFLLPILVNQRDIEPTVIKKTNQFISFKSSDVQLLDILFFLGGATNLDSFLKAYKTSETKGFFSCEWFDHPDKMQNTRISPIFRILQ